MLIELAVGGTATFSGAVFSPFAEKLLLYGNGGMYRFCYFVDERNGVIIIPRKSDPPDRRTSLRVFPGTS